MPVLPLTSVSHTPLNAIGVPKPRMRGTLTLARAQSWDSALIPTLRLINDLTTILCLDDFKKGLRAQHGTRTVALLSSLVQELDGLADKYMALHGRSTPVEPAEIIDLWNALVLYYQQLNDLV